VVTATFADDDLLHTTGLLIPSRAGHMAIRGASGDDLGASEIRHRVFCEEFLLEALIPTSPGSRRPV
jgi:hypothetical protein